MNEQQFDKEDRETGNKSIDTTWHKPAYTQLKAQETAGGNGLDDEGISNKNAS